MATTAENNIISKFRLSNTSNFKGYRRDGTARYFADREVGIWRHSNNCGSVLIFDNFGTTNQLFVSDCRYRFIETWRKYGVESNMPAYSRQSESNTWFLSELSREQNVNPPVISVSYLRSEWPGLNIDWSARNRTETWRIQYGVAAQRVRNINIFYGGMDIPTMFQTMVIFIMMNYIDELDASISSYRQYALGNARGQSGKRWSWDGTNRCWTSTEHIGDAVRHVGYDGNCGSDDRDKKYGILPVREL